VPEPSPVGAAVLLQPTGQAVLARLGLLAEVEARSARGERLHGETAGGRVVMRRWHDGRLVFVGDSGHAMSPQLGQGVNLALLDAHVLAGCLERHSSVDAALAAYSEARRAHLRFYSWASRLMTPVFQSHLGALGPPRDLLLHPVSRIPWMRRQFVSALAGAKTGVLSTLDYDA
jgi:2-polyprenyl-6-methoxyphenol hydroxylase-like FAD-dependent oxidoreductase